MPTPRPRSTSPAGRAGPAGSRSSPSPKRAPPTTTPFIPTIPPPAPRSPPLPRELLAVRLFQQRPHIVGRARLPQEPPEGLLREVLEDHLHRLQVILRLVLRREQQEDRV